MSASRTSLGRAAAARFCTLQSSSRRESQNIQSWERPSVATGSNPWLRTGPPQNQTLCVRAVSKRSLNSCSSGALPAVGQPAPARGRRSAASGRPPGEQDATYGIRIRLVGRQRARSWDNFSLIPAREWMTGRLYGVCERRKFLLRARQGAGICSLCSLVLFCQCRQLTPPHQPL